MEAPEIPLLITLDEADDEVDILLVPEPVPSVAVRLDPHVYVRVHPETNLPVGITIASFSLWAWKHLAGYQARQWDRRQSSRVLGPIQAWMHRLTITARLLLRGPRTGQELLANRRLLTLEVRSILRQYEQTRPGRRVPLVSSN